MAADRWYAIVEGIENPYPEVAVEYAIRAVEGARTPSETRRAFEVAAQLGRNKAQVELEAFLVERTLTSASIYYGTGRSDEARATADALVREFPGTEHARRAWLTRSSLAQDRGDFTTAEEALQAVERSWPSYEADVLRDALRAARTLEATGLESPVEEEPLGPREERLGGSIQKATSGVDNGLPVVTELHPPYPNPTATTVSVPLALAEDADVTIVVVNTLGRQVRVLAQVMETAGQHTYRIATESLAPGVYLVQAIVTTSTGTSRFARRLTVLR